MKRLLVILGIVSIAFAAYAQQWGDEVSPLGQLGVEFLATAGVPPYSKHHAFGLSKDVNSSFELTIWDGASFYRGQNATVESIVEIFSDDAGDAFPAGGGARTLEIFGLDQNFNEISETVELSGITPKDTTLSYRRLYAAIVRSAGDPGRVNLGTITIRQKDNTLIVFSEMFPGTNSSLVAAYTIPTGKTGYFLEWYASQNGGAQADTLVRLIYNTEGEPQKVEEEWGLRSLGTSLFERRYSIPKGPVPEHTDIQVQAISDLNAQTVAAGFDVIMIDN